MPDLAILPEWIAVYVMPKHEKRIAEHFRVQQIEYFLPLYETRHKWKDGSKVTLQLPLFPGYVFVRSVRSRRGRILEVPGVLNVVGKRDGAVISDTYIHSLREGVIRGKIAPHPYLVAGTRVRLKSGSMAGMEGVLVRKKGSCRIVVTLELLMQSVAVEVDMADLEPAQAQMN
ncbi:MAG TPA: UpxY family transcription antiterminator [Candidatus Angelobacter sp.]